MTEVTDVLRGLYDFWNGFAIKAYPEFNVPDDAKLPYITYELKQPNWRGEAPYFVRVWYEDTSYLSISQKVKQIADAIGEGKRIAVMGGSIYLFKDDMFLQWQPVEDDEENLKIAYLSMIIHVIA